MRFDDPALKTIGPAPSRVLVVFRDATELRWLRVLKRGFRHCTVAVETERGWVLIDALSHRTHIKWLSSDGPEGLVARFAAAGLHAIETRSRAAPARLAVIP